MISEEMAQWPCEVDASDRLPEPGPCPECGTCDHDSARLQIFAQGDEEIGALSVICWFVDQYGVIALMGLINNSKPPRKGGE